MKKTYEIYGGYHNVLTPIRIKADPEIVESNGILGAVSDATATRIRRHMCGIKGCMCDVHHGWIIEQV